MAPLCVSYIDFGAMGCKKYPMMITVRLPEGRQCRLTCSVLKGSGSIDQASVKENPAESAAGCVAVGKGERDGQPSEGGPIDPRQRRAVPKQLFSNDPSAWLLHRDMTASPEFG
jgi:hypothetical protein